MSCLADPVVEHQLHNHKMKNTLRKTIFENAKMKLVFEYVLDKRYIIRRIELSCYEKLHQIFEFHYLIYAVVKCYHYTYAV